MLHPNAMLNKTLLCWQPYGLSSTSSVKLVSLWRHNVIYVTRYGIVYMIFTERSLTLMSCVHYHHTMMVSWHENDFYDFGSFLEDPPSHRTIMTSYYVSLLLAWMNKVLNKESSYHWFETLWSTGDVIVMQYLQMSEFIVGTICVSPSYQ